MIPKGNTNEGLVYSTEQGRMCPGCSRPVAECVCRGASTIIPGDGVVRVSRETKGRKGKGVTLITGIPQDLKGLQKLAKQLKRRCGAGGTVKEGVIEIQGEHRDLLVAELEKLGFTVKRSGG
jgi:translation initiation factor 1